MQDRLSKTLYGIFQPHISKEIEGIAQSLQKAKGTETYQFNTPMFANMMSAAGIKHKPEEPLSYNTLRNFSIHYPIARACIDYIKNKLSKLAFGIIPVDEEDEGNPDDPRVKVASLFFASPLGKYSTYRELIEATVEDYLVLGAYALEKRHTRGGQFLQELKLVDSATIELLVDGYGRTPLPPDPAYRQVINGQVHALLSQDDLLYVKRNHRTNSPYGISPIESIIRQTQTALQSAQYDRDYFTEGNVPEGFGEVPEGWDLKQIQEFQSYFDAMMTGNLAKMRRIKFVPHGFKYTAAKNTQQDVGLERLDKWLLQQTCSVFGVPPQDIGFTMDVNRATGEVQQELGQDRALKPLAEVYMQVFTKLIQEDMGFQDLQFVFPDLDPVNAKEEAEVENMRLRSGVISIDEIRQAQGLEPIGVGHYVEGNVKLVEDLKVTSREDATTPTASAEKPEDEDMDDTNETKTENKEQAVIEEMRKWCKQSKHAMKQGKPLKRFVSSIIAESMTDEVFAQLKKVSTREQIDQVFAPYLSGSMQVLTTLQELSHVLDRLTPATD